MNEVTSASVAHGAEREGTFATQLQRALLVFLFLMALCAPHSIAATQIAWSFALLFWMIRLVMRPRPALLRTPVDVPMILFFLLTLVSAIFSYDPDVSIPLLRGALLFTIAYLFAQNINSRRVLRLLALLLLASCMINVCYTLGQRIVGRGVKVEGVAESSPLYAGGIRSGDTLLEVEGRPLSRLRDLYDEVARDDATKDVPVHVQVYRYEWVGILDVPRDKLLEGETVTARLGVESWSRGRDWRATGFYNHWTTYSEALQLIASLAVGLFIALKRKLTWKGALLLAVILGQSAALLLTVTRASWLAFLVSIFVIVLVGASRKTVLLALACAVVLVPAALFVLQQKRNVGFLDTKDASTSYRETVWREGFDLLKSKPRHLLVGIGMNSIKR
ncbi:MAG: O-antigen ligase family protein, partial [Pyrinomonadaceae bacterium]